MILNAKKVIIKGFFFIFVKNTKHFLYNGWIIKKMKQQSWNLPEKNLKTTVLEHDSPGSGSGCAFFEKVLFESSRIECSSKTLAFKQPMQSKIPYWYLNLLYLATSCRNIIFQFQDVWLFPNHLLLRLHGAFLPLLGDHVRNHRYVGEPGPLLNFHKKGQCHEIREKQCSGSEIINYGSGSSYGKSSVSDPEAGIWI
jgi:hypothetical protein